jgi:nitrous oxidase accessory protein NosD
MTRSRWVGPAFALVAVSGLLLVFGVPTPATPAFDGHPTHLDSCSEITESGRYVLTDDIDSRSESCIRIEADDVILDGGNHVVDGHEFRENTTGVSVTGRNVTVRDLTALNWTFGVTYEGARSGTVRNVTTWRTGDGVTVSDSPETRVERVTATNGFTGIFVRNSDGSRVSNSVTRDTSSIGVFVADSGNVTVTNASVVRSETGVALLGEQNGEMSDSVVRSTGEAVLLVDSHDNVIRNATLSNPDGAAVVTRSNASDNRLVAIHGNWTYEEASGTTTKKKSDERVASPRAPVG